MVGVTPTPVNQPLSGPLGTASLPPLLTPSPLVRTHAKRRKKNPPSVRFNNQPTLTQMGWDVGFKDDDQNIQGKPEDVELEYDSDQDLPSNVHVIVDRNRKKAYHREVNGRLRWYFSKAEMYEDISGDLDVETSKTKGADTKTSPNEDDCNKKQAATVCSVSLLSDDDDNEVKVVTKETINIDADDDPTNVECVDENKNSNNNTDSSTNIDDDICTKASLLFKLRERRTKYFDNKNDNGTG